MSSNVLWFHIVHSLIIFSVYSKCECILMYISCSKGKKIRYWLNSLASVCLCQLQGTPGEPLLHTGLDELVTLSWLSYEAGGGGSGAVILAYSLGLQHKVGWMR